MNNYQDRKLHYKMYKSGKNWVVAGIVSATMSIVLFQNINDVTAKASQNQITYSGSYASTDSGSAKSAYSASSYINGSSSLSVPSTDNSNKSSLASSTNSSVVTSSLSSNVMNQSSNSHASSISSDVSNQSQSSKSASTSSNSSEKSDSASQSNNSVQSYESVSLSVSLASNASQNLKSHTKNIDGKTYFYDLNNNEVKSALIDDNNTYYYFGPNGYLTTFDDSKFSDGSINSSDQLSIYTPDGKSITNVDGFLTADSWYRPKQIQVSDTQWRNSTNADFRPLLSVWWPNKTVEINYLNYMSKNGLVNGHFDNNSSANDINQAAATVRLSIENKIKADNGDLSAIRSLFTTFINSQDEWNIDSEDYNSGDGLQGGSLLFGNNSETKDANSNYRLLNRNPTQQDGKIDYTHTQDPGFEFLLANDVDNSNPVVQAETLNWLHYLMNFGSIVNKDSSANFDGVRVDAVDNMDADVLNIISQYFRDAYKINANDVNSNNHLSILEDWSGNDPYYQKDHGTNQMTLDSDYLSSLRSILMYNPSVRSDMSTIINAGIVDRADDNTTNKAIPNYEIVRAHDAGVQDIISQIIIDNIDPHASASNPTWEQMREAFKIYDADENSTVKKYTQYNIPASYALTLTNKDTTPRVYYGDLYTDDGQFMEQKTPYYDAIAEMLKSRVKYVAGGQHMEAVKVNNGEDTILTSVRYGKDALNADDLGDSLTRTSGIAVVESNNPTLSLSDKDKVVIHMGAAHKNQEYRQLLTASNSGIDSFDSDSSKGYVVVRTDDNGDLTLDGNIIKGYANPQVSGYLSMWVPLGASDNQDIRTAPSSESSTDGQSIHSNEASDSNVILEAFSNFQNFPQTTDQYENVVIQKNAEDFKNLGFTYLELPPQYKSTKDGSFIDSVVQNGYSFNDRYDLGFDTPTKYGTAEQLIDAIKSLHAQGIKVLADIVPDQIYSLPNQQIVNATRTNPYGDANFNSNLINVLYDAFSKGSGTDYQYKYGGEFLEQLKKLYPDLFTTKQISTGQPIDASKKLKIWTAEYLNGSNIQGRGSGYVLSSTPNSNYYTVVDDGNTNIKSSNLPKGLLGDNVEYGLKLIDGKMKYVSTGGFIAKNTFIQDDNHNWYYVDNNGDFVTSPQVINGNKYFFLSNGVNLRDFISVNSDGTMNYYQSNGILANNPGYYYSNNINQMVHVNNNGVLDTGIVNVNGYVQYFDDNGYQVKGDIVNFNGRKMYFDDGSGNLVYNRFVSYNGNWYYAGSNGLLVNGLQNINNQSLYFDDNGKQVKGGMISLDNHKMYFDANSGNLYKNSFVLLDGDVYYANNDGYIVNGYQNIGGRNLYFDSDGKQVKDQFVNINGNKVYFNGTDGSEVKDDFIIHDDKEYYADNQGHLLTGYNFVNGQNMYFNEDGSQVKNSIVSLDGKLMYFDENSGNQVKNGFILHNGNVYYSNKDGILVTGYQNIDGQDLFFNADGTQIKGGTAEIDGVNYYFENGEGHLVGKVDQVINSNRFSDNKLLDANNNVVKGLIFNNGQLQYFDSLTGDQAKNKQIIADGNTYYFDNSGNGTYLFTNIGESETNDFSQRNAANSVNLSDYKNVVDGFFTADTWYRPKQILDNGTTWRNSNSNDFRPMITVWWPNKNVQVNYLKLMQNNNLLDKSTNYTLQSNQQMLNQAAQNAQVNIEKKIAQTGNTDWLNDLLFKGNGDTPSFVKQQYIWNILSESPGQDDALLQNGYFKYVNSELTPNTNSSYRISNNLCDFLLANDVDNSNPAVQAEDLNWLYYLTNFGTITANDPNANFDSIRIDAYAFINNDIVQRSNDYMKQKYKLTESSNNANSHLSIVEAGVDAGTTSTNNDELVESPFRTISYGLIHKDRNPQDMNNFIKEVDTGVVIADHENNSQEIGQPNYSIVHAHDKDIQDKVGEAIVDATGIKDWTNFTPSELSAGLKLYYDDQRSSEKKYNDYNIPSAYAIMLTNKGTVPRIYYGDMYQDDGQFMQKQSVYYDDIVSLLTARKKYVSGGQSMSVDHNNFLESVRFGKGAGSESDSGNAETRNEGIGLIVGNDQNKKLNDGDTVVLHMGAAHRNQKYRALMLTTNDGIKNYDSDENAPIAETDSNGDLVFSNKDINGQANTSVRGVLNPEVAGYVAAWVPLGASDDQDSRTLSSNKSYNDGKVLHSGDDLDSNVIFEAFSNFQPEPTNENEYENVVIPQKASLFKDWGITSFELPPQYRSSNDHTFVDATINNGYAFSDRYDLGFGQPTKYGTDVDLRNTIKSLHDNGMQVMADVVYNQLYNLPGQEVVSAVRAGFTGNTVSLPFGNQLYVVNTVGGGDYQKKYGGAFLQKLYQEYPSLFDSEKYQYNSKNYVTDLLVMTDGERSAIPSDQPITEWSAKYMNGTNILGRGMGYVLKDWNTGTYFKLNGNNSVLPDVLTYRNSFDDNTGTQSSSSAQSSASNHETQISSSAQSSASNHEAQSSSSAQSSVSSHEVQSSSSAQSSASSHEVQSSSSAQSSASSHEVQSSSSAQSSASSYEAQSSSSAQSSASSHEVQSSSSAQSSVSSHETQSSSSAQSSASSHEVQSSSSAQSSASSNEAQSSSSAQSSASSHEAQSSSSAQSSASSHEAQSSSSAQNSASSHEAQSSSSAQSSASSHEAQSSSSAQSSASSHEAQSSSSAQSSASSHEAQSSSSAQSSASSHEAQKSSSAQSSASSHGEQGKTSAHGNGNGVSQNKPSQSHANDDSDKVLSNRKLTTNNQVSNDHSVNNQTTQHVSNVNTLSRTKTRENQKIQSKMLTTKSLKQVNKQASSQEKLVKKELKQLDKLKAELKKHSSKKLKKEYNALLQKYKANKKYYLALVAEQNTVEKYLKSAKNLKKDKKALNSLNKKLAKDKKELKRHTSKKLKKTYEKDIKGKKKLTKAIKKYKGDEAKLKKAIVNNFKKASSMKSKKK
ncbi:KxYKxGKxW signal peptide domain-containing protein [Apilactobacillus kunkeei]|uniref:glycoside hydrolase family 70 protein n=3 Tax=Apilactobacillus kunkeei TaxID=148814 RepID=UPI001C6FBDC5|nr:glycoside hydrolase family 70 protein [Apilactobacillus kunkeei]QYU52893.1 KxYKxGKxW signal peptide domain-containing protein [Apilactobacillus kunkeei]